jgi:formylglycine-generating enzyme required for sulfatase activity
MKDANWRRPSGPKSNIKGLDDHPVVHVSYGDALAYAKWAWTQTLRPTPYPQARSASHSSLW